jgi:hypothetical protein
MAIFIQAICLTGPIGVSLRVRSNLGNVGTMSSRSDAKAIAREVLALAAMPNVRVFPTEHEAERAELTRKVVKTPSGAALRICWPPRRRRSAA